MSDIYSDINELDKLITDELITEAKYKTISDYINNLNLISGIAYNLAANEASTQDPFYDKYYLDNIKKISKFLNLGV